MNIHGLFPIPLGITTLDRNLTKKEFDFVKSLEFYKNEGNSVSSNRYVLKDNLLKEIK